MALKLVTFELSLPSRSAQLAGLIRSLGEVVRLTDTAFILDTPLTTAEVLKKLMKGVDLDDDVYVLEMASFWSGYGTTSVHEFLESHLRGEATAPPKMIIS